VLRVRMWHLGLADVHDFSITLVAGGQSTFPNSKKHHCRNDLHVVLIGRLPTYRLPGILLSCCECMHTQSMNDSSPHLIRRGELAKDV